MHGGLTARIVEAAAIEAGAVVVDIGCGAGDTTYAAAAAGAGRVVGVDVSAPLLAEAERRRTGREAGEVTFIRADAQTYGFAAGSFDAAISRFGLMFFSDPRIAFANIATALRPGGRLVFSSWQSPQRNEYFTLPLSVLAARVPLPNQKADGPGGFSLADPDRIRDLLSGAGFDQITITSVEDTPWIARDVDDAVSYLRSTTLARSVLPTLDDEANHALDNELRMALAPKQTADGLRLGTATWLVEARYSAP
ncbi:methyltransferase domain-containing protein [Nocardia sp. ET3-3]|uniref:Methyltransferase domain-containing protein n=2 Tax=Nocardia terrae TaxID=2675851 RepID=A0A7K1V7D5_9NOCA|nr:methyltransferase domain-containing protein [Nocardia terrae]